MAAYVILGTGILAGGRMRRISGILTVCIVTLTACESPTEPGRRCEGFVREGELHVVMQPNTGPFGYGETVAIGDTLLLTAEVRPAIGAYIDVWGSGACAIDFGDPVAAVIEWSSSDDRVATVSPTGAVVGRQQGNATITARAAAQGVSASREIGVWIRGGGSP
jgi:hypothetical protein